MVKSNSGTFSLEAASLGPAPPQVDFKPHPVCRISMVMYRLFMGNCWQIKDCERRCELLLFRASGLELTPT
eukprot:3460489-Rhodomonas_salina.1